MKKFLFASIMLFAVCLTSNEKASAQFIAPKANYHVLFAGGAGDTTHASLAISAVANLLPAERISTIKIQCRVDSLSGTPAGTAKLYFSNDGTNWDPAATTSVTWTFTSASDTIFNIAATSVTAAYAKLLITPTSGTQKIKIRATLLGAY